MVLVEGFPGSGKSTTAQWLARRLRVSGRHAEWFHEGQSPHPVLDRGPAAPDSWRASFAEWLHRWSDFSAQAGASDTVRVLESAWLQVPIFRMLGRDLAPGVIGTFLRKSAEAVQSLAPVLVYLSEPEPEAAMRRLWERRGMAWALSLVQRTEALRFVQARRLSGFDGLLRYWREHNDLAEAAARGASMPTLVIDPRHGGWEERRRRIATFVGVERVTDPPSSEADPTRFVGEYHDGTRRLSVGLRDGGLVVDGLLWPGNRLLPVGPNVLEAESCPLILTFVETDGGVRAVRIDGPAIGHRRPAGTYERVG